MSDLYYTLATKKDFFIKIFWRFYRFNEKEFSSECLYILEDVPVSFFGIYYIKD